MNDFMTKATKAKRRLSDASQYGVDYWRRCLNCCTDYGPGQSTFCPHKPLGTNAWDRQPDPEAGP